MRSRTIVEERGALVKRESTTWQATVVVCANAAAQLPRLSLEGVLCSTGLRLWGWCNRWPCCF